MQFSITPILPNHLRKSQNHWIIGYCQLPLAEYDWWMAMECLTRADSKSTILFWGYGERCATIYSTEMPRVSSADSLGTAGMLQPEGKRCLLFVSSPEPRLEWAFLITICPLSVVVVVVVVVVVNFSHFHLLLQNHWPIATKLGTKHPWVKGIQVCSNKGPRFFPRGDYYEIAKIYWRNLKSLLQNHWANFNQTWHNASLGDV